MSLSFDSEITHADIFRDILKDPRLLRELEEALDDLHFAARLASEHERLLRVSENALPSSRARVDDPNTNNLQGALAYAAEILKNSSEANEQQLARKLAAWSEEITKAGSI